MSGKTGPVVRRTRGALTELRALHEAAALDVLLAGVYGVEGQQGLLVSSLKAERAWAGLSHSCSPSTQSLCSASEEQMGKRDFISSP